MAANTYSYTGSEVTWIVPAGGVTGGTVTVDMAGGSAGNDSAAGTFQRLGARLQATLTVTAGETIRIGVAAKGVDATTPPPGTPGAGGFYAGAAGGASSGTSASGGGGGGQSYIKRGGVADSNRVLVAAGSGGCGNNNGTAPQTPALLTESTTASSATAGATGITSLGGGGGGGGGWVGGIGGTAGNRGGTGSSMAHSIQTSSPTLTHDYQTGNGYVTITYTALSLVQAKTTTDNTNATSMTGTLTSSTAAGNILVATLSAANSGSITVTATPSGWNLLHGPLNAGGVIYTTWLYWKVAVAGETSWTWTISQSVARAVSITEVTGAASTAPISATASGIGGATTINPPSLTTVAANSFILSSVASVAASSSAAATFTTSSGTTLDAQGGTSVSLYNNVSQVHIHDTSNQIAVGPTTQRLVTSGTSWTYVQAYAVAIAPAGASATAKTIATKFFPTALAIDQTFTSANSIKKLEEVAPAANATTTNTWTTTTPQVRTHVPLAASSTATDTSSDNGWALNNGGADGLGSTATENRMILAGVWGFSMSYTLNAPATLTTIACTVVAKVYRVASAGGSRTLLFSASSANFSATGVITWNSASQSKFTLAAGEVIEVGFVPTSAATANALGTITNTVLILNLGSSSFFTVPSPGVRTDYLRSLATIGVGIVTQVRAVTKLFSVVGVGTIAQTRAVITSKTFSLGGTGVPTLSKFTQVSRTFNFIGQGTATRNVVVGETRSLIGIGTPTFVRSANVVKSFSLIGTGTVPRNALVIIFLSRTVNGTGTTTLVKASQIYRTFGLAGYGHLLTTGPNATTIAVPIDEIPGGSVAPTTTYIFPILD